MEDWLAPLQAGQAEVAWEWFLSRYRQLIFASIRHYTRDYDDGMDLFAYVCERLRADGMARVRARAEDTSPRARFSTWLVAVVRHHVVDWFRHRDGRRRLSSLARSLSPRQRRIFELVFLDQRSHVETYELLCAGETAGLSFGQYLAELRETYRLATEGRRGHILRELAPAAPAEPAEADPGSPVELAERQERLGLALETLAPDDRLMVQLYILDDLPAERVALILGLANAKAVYNRVYRILAELRAWLADAGIHPGDL